MREMMDRSTGTRKEWFFWAFRGSAMMNMLAAVLSLFVLVQTSSDSLFVRSTYIITNQTWIIISWISLSLAILSTMGIFTILAFALDKKYRLILQWAWMIHLIGGVAMLIYQLIQMTLIPVMSQLFIYTPSLALANHIWEWDQLLNQVIRVFIPSCFAVSGLIYTAIMFRTKDFSIVCSWWSFVVWTLLLVGILSVRWLESIEPVVIGATIFIYIPWLWVVGDEMKPRFSTG